MVNSLRLSFYLFINNFFSCLDAFLYNNCRALNAGFASFREVLGEEVDIAQR
jgi:hypothetical protein